MTEISPSCVEQFVLVFTTNTGHIYLACNNWLYNSLATIEFRSYEKKRPTKGGNVYQGNRISQTTAME